MARAPLAERLKGLDKLAENFNKKNGEALSGRVGVNAELRQRIKVELSRHHL